MPDNSKSLECAKDMTVALIEASRISESSEGKETAKVFETLYKKIKELGA